MKQIKEWTLKLLCGFVCVITIVFAAVEITCVALWVDMCRYLALYGEECAPCTAGDVLFFVCCSVLLALPLILSIFLLKFCSVRLKRNGNQTTDKL